MLNIFGSGKKNNVAKTVSRDTIVGNILDMDPTVASIFLGIGMHCLGCPSARAETLEQACAVHGVDCDELIQKVNAHMANNA